MMDKDPRTEKLYLADPYTTAFEATVLSCREEEGGRAAAVLDRTYFYPESGGQPSDRGTLGGVDVVDVKESEAGIVYHYVASPVQPGRAECRVDWERRFDHMQQHTGQHILSRAFIEVGKLETVSFHLGEETCTIDLDGPALDAGAVERAESLANSVVWENRGIAVRSGPPAGVEEKPLRKALPTGVDEARLVEVEGFDTIGCCGTHVRHAGELGIIKVLRYEKTKGVYRVYFVVGKRAYRDLARKHDIVKNLANRFTTSVGALEDKIGKLETENQRLRKESQKLSKKLVAYEADRLHQDASRHGDRFYVVEMFVGAGEEYIRLLGSHLRTKAGTVSLLGSEDGLIVCTAADDVPAGVFSTVLDRAKSLGGSGGGKGNYATLRLPASASPADFLQSALEDVRNA